MSSINPNWTKVWRTLLKVVVIVWVEERLDSIWAVDCNIWNVICEIRKNLWTTLFCTGKWILIFIASRNANWTKVSTTLEEVLLIVWVEKRIDSIWTVDCSIWNVFWGIRKKFKTIFFSTSKLILIFLSSTNAYWMKVSTTLEVVVLIVRVEERVDSIWNLGCSIRNVFCGIRIKWLAIFFFTPVNQSYFLWPLQMVIKQRFQRH